jgi:2-polyprenyl-3-methyl-5-hydroxy-6-metoxy-1,4-benzoquinol methylase
MPQNCRFCKRGNVRELFPSNRNRQPITVSAFACTNCGFGHHGQLVKCSTCGIVYINEKIAQEKVSAYYEVAEDPLYLAEQAARERTFRKYLKGLRRIFPQKGKLFDVGTNTGLFVKIARDHGWNAVGLEPNVWGVAYARDHYGLRLINKPFEKRSGKFSVITMWDVVEHFTDPVSKMKLVFSMLEPGGVFAFSTVDPESFLARVMGTKWSWYMEMHKVFFSRQSARFYLEKLGFRRIIFRPHWRFLSLGYLCSRLVAVSPRWAAISGWVAGNLGLSKVIVPYYANDLYDCYVFKP